MASGEVLADDAVDRAQHRVVFAFDQVYCVGRGRERRHAADELEGRTIGRDRPTARGVLLEVPPIPRAADKVRRIRQCAPSASQGHVEAVGQAGIGVDRRTVGQRHRRHALRLGEHVGGGQHGVA